jgi:hypothetical protein
MARLKRIDALTVRWWSTISIRLGSLCVMAAVLGCRTGAEAPHPAPRAGQAGYTKPVSFAVLEDYDKDTPLSEVAADFALFKELGVSAWRGSFGWDDYEPVRGKFDLEWLDRFASLADSMGISLRPYLGYTPDWSAKGGSDENVWNDPPRKIEDWIRFARTVASKLRRHRSVVSYEIYNEENVPLWWDGTAADYERVLAAGSKAVRLGHPRAGVLLGGMVWPDLAWLESACAGGHDVFDILPFHAYPETWTPDSVTVENYLGARFRTDFVSRADQLCGKKPIWINETGFATTPGKTEREQALWWVRAFATFLAEPRVEHLGIYEIRDQRKDTPVIGDAPNYYLGLVRRDGGRKLAFETVKLLVRLFGTDSITVADSALEVRVSSARSTKPYSHLFVRPDGSQLVFVWDRTGNTILDLELPRPFQRVTAYDLDGRGSEWKNLDDRAILGVTLGRETVGIFEAGPAGNPAP